MKLPKIDLPTYDFVVPSSGKKIKYRPFLVKEQKILLMAMESNDEKDSIRAIRQIISNCIVDEKFDVQELSSFDIEYFFVKLRMTSVGEKVKLSFRCKNTIEENKECNHLMEFEYDLNEVIVEKNPQHNKTIFFTKDVGVVMKYPGFELTEYLIENVKSEKSSTEKALDMIVSCIDYFFDKDNVYYTKEMTKKDIIDYIENVPKASFDQIETFFDTFPKIKSIINHKCEKCNYDHVIPVEGMTNFFV